MRPACRSVAVRLEAWLWTGPLGHLVGGVLDWAELLSRYWLGRARTRAARELGVLRGRLARALRTGPGRGGGRV